MGPAARSSSVPEIPALFRPLIIGALTTLRYGQVRFFFISKWYVNPKDPNQVQQWDGEAEIDIALKWITTSAIARSWT